MCAFIRGVQFSRNPSGPGADSFAMQLIPEDRLGLIRKAFTGSIAGKDDNLPAHAADEIISRALRGMPTAAQVLGRSAYVEKKLETFASSGSAQYVILGAGLDSYALRKKTSSGVKVFEIDRRETQDFKKKQIIRINGTLPSDTECISADLSLEKLSAALQRSSFDRNVPAFFSAQGLLMYLAPEEIANLFCEIASVSMPGSLVSFDYFDEETHNPEKSSEAFRAWLDQGKLTGELFKSCFSIDELRGIADTNGFRIEEHLEPEDIQKRFFENHPDGYSACEHVHFMTLEKTKG
jgi:methyltransferase (TIGR00027 family)